MKTVIQNDGYYYPWASGSTQSGPDLEICVNNNGQKIADVTNCEAEKALADGDLDVATYLELSEEEQTDLANYQIEGGALTFIDDSACSTHF